MTHRQVRPVGGQCTAVQYHGTHASVQSLAALAQLRVTYTNGKPALVQVHVGYNDGTVYDDGYRDINRNCWLVVTGNDRRIYTDDEFHKQFEYMDPEDVGDKRSSHPYRFSRYNPGGMVR